MERAKSLSCGRVPFGTDYYYYFLHKMKSHLIQLRDECRVIKRDLISSQHMLDEIKYDLQITKIMYDLHFMQLKLDENQQRLDQVQLAMKDSLTENVAEIELRNDDEQRNGRGWLAGIWRALVLRMQAGPKP